MAVAAVLGGLLIVIQAADVWLFKILVDDVLVAGDLAPLPQLIAAFVALNLTASALEYGETMLAARCRERFSLRLRTDTFSHLLRRSPLQLGRRRLGDTLTTLSSDVSTVRSFLVSGPGQLADQVLRIVVYGGLLVWLDPLLAGLALLVSPAFWWLSQRFGTRLRGAARERRSRSGILQSRAEEVLSALPQVQVAGSEDLEVDRYRAEGEDLVAAELRTKRLEAALAPLVDMVELAGGLLVVAVGAWSVTSGHLTLGELLAFMTFLSQLYGPVTGLVGLVSTAFNAAASAERLADVYDEAPLVTDAGDAMIPPGPMRGEVCFDEVTFRYDGADTDAVHRVSFTAAPGTVTAFIGPSGSGKSTLASLLLRFADPDSGTVRLDGHDVRTVPLSWLRSNVGLLLQDTYLFDGSVADNVAYGRPGTIPDDVVAALDAAGASDVVAAFSDGIDHRLGPGGASLSGGQRRRVALARALLEPRPVLVLDEFSTGLDTAATAAILDALRQVPSTMLLITHDPAVATLADQVVLVDGGRVVAHPGQVPSW
jgi:ABC-type multidrug transport system fused ATPase/permease subunit